MTKKQKKMRTRILATIAMLAVVIPLAKFLQINGTEFSKVFYGIPLLTIYLAIYIVIGGNIVKKAFKGILNGRIFDENFLMAIATLGAFALAIYTKSGDYLEAIAVMLFYQIGEFFQGLAVGKSRKNISELMDIRPDYANIETDGILTRTDPSTVQPGTIIVVQPGEKIPLDGTIIEGTSTINTSALTGESLPQTVQKDSQVISGCINLTGVLKIKTTKAFEESTVNKILNLVENSTSRKSKSENFISKFARIYTPVVCYGALALAVIPPVISIILDSNPQWSTWIYRALTFLVISCPCALVISIPLTFFAGIGGASHKGILIKGSNYLETLSKTNTVVFDKTGTLTHGNFEVSSIHHNLIEENKLLELACHAECASSHPISKSLQNAWGKPIDRSRVTNIQELSGKGIIATVDKTQVAAGNIKLMESLGLKIEECHCSGTIIYIALDGIYNGHIVISDKIKENSAPAIKLLKKSGIAKTVMLTGDSEKIASHVARELKLDYYYSQLMPQDKVTKVEELLNELKPNQKLAFAGDGINDAPVLTRADIGIAMGALGSDAAIEAADVVLMDDDPLKIPQAIKIAKKCMNIVYQNISFALGIKFLCLVLGAAGIANMWLAIFADVGVMLIAVLNAIRALNVH